MSDASSNFLSVASSVAVTDGNWHHIVAVISAPSGATVTVDDLHIYVDGADVTSQPLTSGSFAGVSPLPFNINSSGQNQGFLIEQGVNLQTGSNPYMDLDEYAVYPYALSAQQILTHYDMGIGAATPTPSPTATPTAAPTATPTAAPTATPTAAPTATPTAAPTPTPTPVPTPTPTPVPTPTPTPVPTPTPTPVPTPTPTPVPTPTPTPVPTPTPSSLDNDVLAMGPTAFYKLDETLGTTVADSSGHKYNIVNRTPSSIVLGVPGLAPDGTAYDFTATSSYASGGGLTIFTNKPQTFVAFVNGTYSASGVHSIFCADFFCLVSNGGHIGIDDSSSPSLGQHLDTSITLTDNTTHLIALEVGAGDVCDLSVDGSPITQYYGAYCGNGRGEAINTFVIGADTNGSVHFSSFPGTIDDAAYFYNKDLTQSQICTIAVDSGLNTNPACL